MWTAVAETGSCVHLTNAQPSKKKKKREGERERGVRREKEASEGLFKIFNPPSIN